MAYLFPCFIHDHNKLHERSKKAHLLAKFSLDFKFFIIIIIILLIK